MILQTELKESRLQLGLTRKDLAKLLWVSDRTIESWETFARNMPEAYQHLAAYRLHGKPLPEISVISESQGVLL